MLHLEIYGTGEPIVLIHGWAMHSGIWRTFAKQLAKHYQVICVDLPNHGRSNKLSEFTLETINQQLQKQLPDRFTIIGWSLGGLVGLDFAARFPKTIQGLILMGSNPCFVKNESWSGMKLDVLEKFTEDLIQDCHGTLIRFLSLQVKGLENAKALLKELKQALQECDLPNEMALQQGLKILKENDLRENLKHLQCPIQVILGSHDSLVPKNVGEQMLELNSEIKLAIIEKAAHVPFLSHSEYVFEILNDFMKNSQGIASIE